MCLSEQRQAIHIDSDSPEAPTTWLEGSYASTYSPHLAPSDCYLFLSISNYSTDDD